MGIRPRPTTNPTWNESTTCSGTAKLLTMKSKTIHLLNTISAICGWTEPLPFGVQPYRSTCRFFSFYFVPAYCISPVQMHSKGWMQVMFRPKNFATFHRNQLRLKKRVIFVSIQLGNLDNVVSASTCNWFTCVKTQVDWSFIQVSFRLTPSTTYR